MTQEKPAPAVPHVYQAINRVQAALAREGIGKNRNNQQQGFKFRGVDDVMNALSPLLAEHGLCVLPYILSRAVTQHVTPKGGTLFYVVVEAEYHFVAVADCTKHVVRVYGEAMDSGDKATNKAMSAAYKYACLQAFSIPTEGDNDADATTHEVVASPPRPAPQQQPIAPPAPNKPVFATAAGRRAVEAQVRDRFNQASSLAEMDAALNELAPQLEQLKAGSPEEVQMVNDLRQLATTRKTELKTRALLDDAIPDFGGAA